MVYNFDEIIDRRGTRSLKWDSGPHDVLPLWVADMDFRIAHPIQKALAARTEHGILGYSLQDAEYYDAISGWLSRRQGWEIQNEWVSHCPGIVPALHFIAQAYLGKGEKIMMHSPVYYPFFNSAQKNGVEVLYNSLQYRNGRYEINFEEFEAIASKEDVKVFYLCTPHNPGGRIWSEEELRRMGAICKEHEVLVVADEIHGDLILPGHHFVSYGRLSEEFLQNSILCIAPSKSFNLAGLQTSCLIIPNPEIKAVYDGFLDRLGIMRPGIFGMIGLVAAYTEGDEWLDQLLVYLQGNMDYLLDYCQKNLPKLKIMVPEATYLVWMDVSMYLDEGKITNEELHQKLLDEGKVWLDEGYMFGETGRGFERINIACPRATLKEALKRMREILEK